MNNCKSHGNRLTRIYVCSPLRPKPQSPEASKAELEDNLDRAKTACRLVTDLGGIPICSHLFCTQFLDDSIPAEREKGRRIGLELLKDADELWCFSEQITEGMAAEITEASRLGIPVRMFCETVSSLIQALGGSEKDSKSGCACGGCIGQAGYGGACTGHDWRDKRCMET